MRCLTLAGRLARAGWSCAFATGPETSAVVPGLRGAGVDVFVLSGAGGAAELADRFPSGADLLVVDHYGLDAGFESACRSWARRILVIDDLADRPHDCDLLVDAGPGCDADRYLGLVPGHCRVLLGPDHAILRDAFAALRPEALARREAQRDVGRVLVNFGLGAPHGVTATVLEGILAVDADFAVDVILARQSSDFTKVEALARDCGRISLVEYAADMPGLMALADIAVGAAGTTSWERCCLGLPTLVIELADNQQENARGLALAGAVINLGAVAGVGRDEVAAALSGLVADGSRRRAMSRAAAGVCDGLGTGRILRALQGGVRAAGGKAVELRPARAEDLDIVFAWQCDRRVRRHFRNPQAPSRAEHAAWFGKRLSEPKGFFNIITCGGAPVGVLRLDPAGGDECFEVSIYVAPQHWGQGIASAALAQGKALLPGATLVAEVLPENKASLVLFRKAGFAVGDDGKYVLRPGRAGS